MIRYKYNAQKQPPAPFVRVSLRHPHSGTELQDVIAQIDTGADQTLIPAGLAAALKLHATGAEGVMGVGAHCDTLTLYDVELGIHDFPVRRLEVFAHPNEPWVLLGRDVLNGLRMRLDGPNLLLELD